MVGTVTIVVYLIVIIIVLTVAMRRQEMRTIASVNTRTVKRITELVFTLRRTFNIAPKVPMLVTTYS